MTRIIALDQSYTCTGLAINRDGRVIDWDALGFKKGACKSLKRGLLVTWINNRISEDTSLIVIEQLWTLPGATISAAVIDLARVCNIEVRAINPRQWKKKLLNDANAPKSKSLQFASELVGTELTNDNIADAICISYASNRFPDLLRKAE